MALMKLCPRCNSKFEVGKECPNGCYKKQKQESNAIYDKRQRKNSEFYHSKSWKILRRVCMNKFNHICIWTYYKRNKIVKAEVIHHIVELEEDYSKALEINNLIPVSDHAHREIHKLYGEDRKAVQQELVSMINRWKRIYL